MTKIGPALYLLPIAGKYSIAIFRAPGFTLFLTLDTVCLEVFSFFLPENMSREGYTTLHSGASIIDLVICTPASSGGVESRGISSSYSGIGSS